MTNSPLTLMAHKYGFSHDEFRETIIKTCTSNKFPFSNEEFTAFICVANTYGLNPLTKEIYAFPKKGGGIMPIVSIDGWIKIIKANPNFDGMTFHDQLDNNGNLIAIKCSIRLKNIQDPIEVTEYLSECKQNTDIWIKYPARMLRHKATIQCARYAFGLSGIYDEDEAARINRTNHNTQSQQISNEMLMQIQELMDQTQTKKENILSFAKVEGLSDLSHEKAQTVLDGLKRKQRLQIAQAQQNASIQDAEYEPILQKQEMAV
ncbi:RecT family recombinase [Bartonella sp. B30(2025)]